MKYGEVEIKKSELQVWDNPTPGRDYCIEIVFPEFTCLCPNSGYPDFATIKIIYTPDKYVVELKSLKLYLNRFRDQYLMHEAATNKIYGDLKKLLKPRYIEVIAEFNPRGNVKTVVKISTTDEKKGP
jgi:7-cyano-7-deazaguanine reductase|tara:strand:- start:7592 stop:7972 length:381 start_codon:yes stop_codon:yes gene_type:complete